MPSILIVCTANLCRSPMAEAILKRLIADRPDADQWHIESAGIWADIGRSPVPISEYVMKSRGMDISTQRSQPISTHLVQKCDLVLVMESWQKELLKDRYAEIGDRVFMLSEMTGEIQDIADPVAGGLPDYVATVNELERYLSGGIDRMSQIAFKNHQ